MPQDIFSSEERFKKAFHDGLTQLCQQPGLGAFILCAANATCSPEVYQALHKKLLTAFSDLQARIANGETPQGADEDVQVFKQIEAIGLNNLGQTELRYVDDWEVRFNALRSLRPLRASNDQPESLYKAFDPGLFNFNKPFMRSEQFWSGTLAGLDVSLFYNKYPFIDYHGILVPQPAEAMPQYLTEEHHYYIWQLTKELSIHLPGTGFGYNAYGAYASVNHLHFQMFTRPQALPVTKPHWQHNGGTQAYPASCRRFDSADEAWRYLDELHEQQTAYNLLYLPQGLYCFPRRTQGSYRHTDWSNGFSWYELSGGMLTRSAKDFLALDARGIADEFGKLVPQPDS